MENKFYFTLEDIIRILENKEYDYLQEYYCDNHLDMHYDIHIADSDGVIRFVQFPTGSRGLEQRILVYVIGLDGDNPHFIHHRFSVDIRDKNFFVLDSLVESLRGEIQARRDALANLAKSNNNENEDEENN